MKSIGIVRQVDELGRIVIPIALRKVLGMNEGELEEKERMLLRRLVEMMQT